MPTSPPHRWLIAADWLEEAGAEVAATAFREGIWVLDPNAQNVDENGESFGVHWESYGYGDDYGKGDGHGEGDGQGDGYGHGEGHGFGYGYGNGAGNFHGIGIGLGVVDGCGEGNLDGCGQGYGHVDEVRIVYTLDQNSDSRLSLTQQAQRIFDLLPTSPQHRWLIAADWLEEEGAEVSAAAFRDGIWVLEDPNGLAFRFYKDDGSRIGIGYHEDESPLNGDGHGDGKNSGNSFGEGEGYRHGRGRGNGYGNGNGTGGGYSYGRGEGYSDGEGVGSGYGNGCGNGDGHGDGEGYGIGTDVSWA